MLNTDQASKRATHRTVSVNNSLYVWAGNQGRLPEVHDGEEKRQFTSNIQQFTPSTGLIIIFIF